MKTLYLDLGMGAAGDMLAAALLELLPDRQDFLSRFNALGIPGVTVTAERSEKCGIVGTHFRVFCGGVEEGEHLYGHSHVHGEEHAHHRDEDGNSRGEHVHDHPHSDLCGIEHIVKALKLKPETEDNVLSVYRSIAEAESAVHGKPVTEIHFHEVGTMDAIADVTAVCMLMQELSPDSVVASPVHVGSGTVRCAHGILPVPAPATALLLKGVPVYGGRIQGELCTPTGAALIRRFVSRFDAMPLMTPEKIGYGMGRKDFEQANCVRTVLGRTAEEPEPMLELGCNVDDMTGEEIGFALERISEAGAVEVFTVPIGMKKSRPGILLKAICSEASRDAVVRAIFRHTSTIGIRALSSVRYVLERREETVETAFGPVRRKVSRGYGAETAKWEYEDLARLAAAKGLSVAEVRRKLDQDA